MLSCCWLHWPHKQSRVVCPLSCCMRKQALGARQCSLQPLVLVLNRCATCFLPLVQPSMHTPPTRPSAQPGKKDRWPEASKCKLHRPVARLSASHLYTSPREQQQHQCINQRSGTRQHQRPQAPRPAAAAVSAAASIAIITAPAGACCRALGGGGCSRYRCCHQDRGRGRG